MLANTCSVCHGHDYVITLRDEMERAARTDDSRPFYAARRRFQRKVAPDLSMSLKIDDVEYIAMTILSFISCKAI